MVIKDLKILFLKDFGNDAHAIRDGFTETISKYNIVFQKRMSESRWKTIVDGDIIYNNEKLECITMLIV